MAQVLKDEVRERILAAALPEFYENGYQAAAMRRIAEQAGIPTGLIYSYYKNKADLFDAVLRPVLYDWELVLSTGDETHRDGHISGLSRAELDCLLNLFEHRQEFIILMDKCQGTKYEQEKDRIITAIETHLYGHRGDEIADELYIHIIANNFVDGLMQVMYHYKDKEWALMTLQKLSNMYLTGIGL